MNNSKLYVIVCETVEELYVYFDEFHLHTMGLSLIHQTLYVRIYIYFILKVPKSRYNKNVQNQVYVLVLASIPLFRTRFFLLP